MYVILNHVSTGIIINPHKQNIKNIEMNLVKKYYYSIELITLFILLKVIICKNKWDMIPVTNVTRKSVLYWYVYKNVYHVQLQGLYFLKFSSFLKIFWSREIPSSRKLSVPGKIPTFLIHFTKRWHFGGITHALWEKRTFFEVLQNRQFF